MVSEVEDAWYSAIIYFLVAEAASGSPHFGLAGIATTGQVGHPQLMADTLEDTCQSLLFYPALRPVFLVVPETDLVLTATGADDLGRVLPDR